MIRQAQLTDLDQIMVIIKKTIEEMKTYNNTQWDENYPQATDFEKDILHNDLYVSTDEGIVTGFICINYIEPSEYNDLNWSSNEPCMVIHRMAVNPDYRKKGIGTALMQFAEHLAQAHHITYLKTDTYSINTKMNTLFEKCGYKLAGQMSFLGKEYPFNCYDKLITTSQPLTIAIPVTTKQGESVTLTTKLLNRSHLPQMLALQTLIYEALSDKSLYAPSSEEEFIDYFNQGAKFLGSFTPSHELVTLSVYFKPEAHEHNYGYDLDFSKEQLMQVGQLENMLVHPDFRGNQLQIHLGLVSEKISQDDGTTILLATVSPDNRYSLRTFMELGYEIRKEKLKYGGLKRYILRKDRI